MDLGRALLNIFHISTSNVDAIARGMAQLSDQCGPNSHWVLNPHSNGGQTTYLASRQLNHDRRGKIQVESVGSTHIFSKEEGFSKARNYSGLSDVIPMISHPHGLIASAIMGREGVSYMGSPFQGPCFSHAYRSKEYSALLTRIVDRHR